MKRKLTDEDKSNMIALHLQGENRDEIARKRGFSAGTVSGVKKDFNAQVSSTSFDGAAKMYKVAETVDQLRNVGVFLRENGISLEQSSSLLHFVGEIKKIMSLERFVKLLRNMEGWGPKHFEAAFGFGEMMQQTGMSPDAILKQVGEAEKKVGELDSEKKKLETEIASLQTQKLGAEQALKDEKTRMDGELQAQLSQHNLTMEQVSRMSSVAEALKDHGIDLMQLEELKNMLCSVQVSGQDPARLIELAKKKENLNSQVETANKKLTELMESIAKKERQIALLMKRQIRANSLARKARNLERMGWTPEALEKTIKLTVSIGSPKDVLKRIELTKTEADLKAEVDAAKLELEKTKQGSLAEMKKISDQLQELTADSSTLVHKTLPSLVSKTNEMMNEKLKMISKRDAIAQDYRELQDKHVKLTESISKYTSHLDSVISWTNFLNEPANVAPTNMNVIFFDFMLPKLLIWGKNKDLETKITMTTETFKRMIIFFDENAQVFFEDPGKAESSSALSAIVSLAFITLPFFRTLSSWYSNHPQSSGLVRDFKYYFEKIYEILTKTSRT